MDGDAKKRGPDPLYDEPMRQYKVTLPPHLLEKAKKIGNDNLSAGVRAVLEDAKVRRYVNDDTQ